MITNKKTLRLSDASWDCWGDFPRGNTGDGPCPTKQWLKLLYRRTERRTERKMVEEMVEEMNEPDWY